MPTELDKLRLERLINEPEECDYRVILREVFNYDVPIRCPYKSMIKAFYEDLKKHEKAIELWNGTLREEGTRHR